MRDAIERLLADAGALRQWGGTVLIWLAEAVVPVASHDPDLARRLAAAILTFKETRDEDVTFAGGALLPLRESRRQQAEHGAYVIGQSFGDLCAADLTTAAEIFCDLADEDLTPEQGDRWPIVMDGAAGWLQFGLDMSATTHDVGEVAAQALSTALVCADPADAGHIVALLVERLHNAAAWAALMSHAGDPVALGRALLPALESGALLVHPDTHPSAAGLLAAVAEHDGDLAGRLEAAVVNAHTLADANDIPQRTKDALIGCLTPDRVTSEALRTRLDDLAPAGLPEILPRMQAMATVEPWSITRRLTEQGIELDAPVEAAARDLHKDVRLITSGANDKAEAEQRLPEVFASAATIFAAVMPLPADLELLLVEAAALLARNQVVVPGTQIGDRVLEVLSAATSNPDAGAFAR